MGNQIERIRAEIERRNLANYCVTAEHYEEELFAILDTIEAEQPEEKDYKRLYKELVNSEWYKKYYQGASVVDSVAVELPEADLDAEIFAWQKAHATEETKQIIAMTARHFAEWGAEHSKK